MVYPWSSTVRPWSSTVGKEDDILFYWVSVTFRGELLNFGRVLALVMGKKWVPTIARVDNMHRFIHEALRQSNIAIENWCFELSFFGARHLWRCHGLSRDGNEHRTNIILQLSSCSQTLHPKLPLISTYIQQGELDPKTAGSDNTGLFCNLE